MAQRHIANMVAWVEGDDDGDEFQLGICPSSSERMGGDIIGFDMVLNKRKPGVSFKLNRKALRFIAQLIEQMIGEV